MDIKQLRCKQCGGSISQHEKYGTYRCDYCHASFFLDESENNAFKPQGISERIPQKTDRYKKIPLKQVHYLPLLCEKDYPGRFLSLGEYINNEFYKVHSQWMQIHREWESKSAGHGVLWKKVHPEPIEPQVDDFEDLVQYPEMLIFHITEDDGQSPVSNCFGYDVFSHLTATSSEFFEATKSKLLFDDHNDWECTFFTKTSYDEVKDILAKCNFQKTKNKVIEYVDHCEKMLLSFRVQKADECSNIRALITDMNHKLEQ